MDRATSYGAKKFQPRVLPQALPIFTDSTIQTLARVVANSGKNVDVIDSLADQMEHRPEASSESGWTAYLDISLDWNAYNSQSRRLDMDQRNGGGVEDGDWGEDSSMESDASTGPEQPEPLRTERLRRNALRGKRKSSSAAIRGDNDDERCIVREDDLDDTCQSNLSCESVSDDPSPVRRQCKRIKPEEEEFHRSPLPRPSQMDDEHSDENEVAVEAGEAEICSPSSVNVHEKCVDSRLELLQHLMPHSSRQLDEEQVLEVAIDYVKSLEEKIKMFGASSDSNPSSSERSASAADSTMTSQTCQAASALQDKGLCMLPLSMVVATTT